MISKLLLKTDKYLDLLHNYSIRFAPHLFAAVSRVGRKRTLREALASDRWARDIVGALTVQVLCQYLKVWEIARDTVLDQTRSDRFVWKWSADGKYSASSTYRAFFAGSTVLLGARELWKTRAPPKVKFFRWLAFHGRLWTADRRRRHGLQDCDACVLCGQASETVEHLFLGCVLARQVWYLLLSPLGLASLTPDADVRFGHWWIRQRKRLDAPAQQLFDSMILLVAWVL